MTDGCDRLLAYAAYHDYGHIVENMIELGFVSQQQAIHRLVHITDYFRCRRTWSNLSETNARQYVLRALESGN